MGFLVPIVAIASVFVGLPWVVLHYMTKWKTAATLTNSDEALLDDLHRLARRLDERMQTVERLVASDHPDFQPGTQLSSHPTEGRDSLRAAFERTRP